MLFFLQHQCLPGGAAVISSLLGIFWESERILLLIMLQWVTFLDGVGWWVGGVGEKDKD